MLRVHAPQQGAAQHHIAWEPAEPSLRLSVPHREWSGEIARTAPGPFLLSALGS